MAAPDTPPRLSPPDRRGTTARFRAAARALFQERGYGATSMDAVATTAPVSKRTLYHHYPGKAELFGAVISEVWSHLAGAPALPLDAVDDARAVLSGFVARLMSHWDQPDVIPFVRLIIAEAPRFPELSAAFFKAGKEPATLNLAAYLGALVKAGRLPPGTDPMLAAAQFLGAIKEPLFWPRVLGVPSAFPADQVVARAIDDLLGRN